MGVEWDRRVITLASLRPVASRDSGSGDSNNGNSARVEIKPARCRVLSRTRLDAFVSVDGEAVLVPNDVGFSPDREAVFEGGVLWYSVSVQALRPGEQALFFPIVS